MYFKPCLSGETILSNRSVVVVNAQLGLGMEIVKFFAKECDWVVGVVGSDTEFTSFKSQFADNDIVRIFKASPATISTVVAALKSAQITPDLLLVYSGRNSNMRPFAQISESEMLEAFRSIVLEPQVVMGAFLPLMRSVSGAVIACVSSDLAYKGSAGKAATAAARHAMDGLMKSAAEDCANDSVAICTVRFQPRQLNETIEDQVRKFCLALLGLRKGNSGLNVECA